MQPSATSFIAMGKKGHSVKILILEDEPIIAIDLEEIVTEALDVSVVHALTVEQALAQIEATPDEPISFALLDVLVGRRGETSLAVASLLSQRDVPFCFVSSAVERLPEDYRRFPRIAKPFRAQDVADAVCRCGARRRGRTDGFGALAA